MEYIKRNLLVVLAIFLSIGAAGYTSLQAGQLSQQVEIICPDTASPGVDGADGEQGIAGQPGVDGADGEQGETGPQGEPGPCGPIGPQGEQGPAGEAGPQGETGSPGPAASEESYALLGGTLLNPQPTFDGLPLFQGSFIRNGDLVYLQVTVDFDNITDFGTGQYFVSLPFPSKYDATIRSGHIQDVSKSRNYPIVGFITAGSDRMTLWFTNSLDEPFTASSPANLAVEDSFHIAGSYIAQPAL